jgi:hypothetical protein
MHKQLMTVFAVVLMASVSVSASVSGCAVGIYPAAPDPAGLPGGAAENGRYGMILTGTGGQRTAHCAGQDVGISGYGMRIQITGTCRSITITGSGNQVEVAEVAAITINGYGNTVHWAATPSGTTPDITDNGEGNTVVPAGLPLSAVPRRGD